jgi:hypothetical protein
LIDDGIADTGTTPSRPSLFTDSIKLIENDNVQSTFVALFFLLPVSWDATEFT